MKTTLTFILLLFYSFSFSQPKGQTEPGKCYAKVLLKAGLDTVYKEYPVYIGEEKQKKRYVRNKRIVLVPSFTKPTESEKELFDNVKTTEQVIVLPIVIRLDKIDSDDIEYRTLTIVKGSLSNEVEWREVLCGNKLGKNAVARIQDVLREDGFDLSRDLAKTNFLTSETKNALKQYQEKHHLPIGNLDLETLDYMGIDY